MKLKKIRIGDLLKEKGYITEAQLKVALNEAKSKGKKLGEMLVELGYITEELMTDVLAEQLGIEKATLEDIKFEKPLKEALPEKLARRFKVVPVDVKDNKLIIATSDPTDIFALDEISRITHKEIIPTIISKDELFSALERIYGTEDKLYKIVDDVEKKIISSGSDEDILRNLAEDASVVNLVDSIIAKALTDKASDIHIEPDEDILRVRYRIDGILHEVLSLNKVLHPAVISRIKIMSNMNIAEKRLPQDGRFKLRKNFKDVDFRVSTLPTNYGEKVVLRILDREKALLDLRNIGMDEYSLKIYEDMISKPYGIILISGPTGSGKTTTLYASLNKLNTPEKNIITVEDPIEYNFKLINQVSVDETAGLTFANALRSILRQDPDIIMIGEIRDKDTAEIAIQASLTGHLVLSTIHTNDAASSAVRLIEMGIENYLVSTSLIGVVGQRLVRKICPHCKVSYKPEKELIERLGLDNDIVLYKGEGCEKCKFSGYQGRIGIYEVMKIDRDIRSLINKNAPIDEIRQKAKENGMRFMRDSGLELVKKGVTTLEEVLRATIVKE
ncbi:GspE/PulE family protein [Hippea maritima]|uniref:Type II secretion system protein E n=1 Tax=Hippea maritima (strain ATCC 700847 / DSM 10411 / MH2) TaxID=760142 RepID=F2LWI6_HIPMA|nr:GspE/PulE family protein [Hippea maritima]AEA34095.1 type II secretion system protein E [Hippea maritima DSM 10411]